MFSKACEYAIRCTIFIASKSNEGQRTDIKTIAQEIESPVAFTAKILQKLVKADIVSSKKGYGGGFEMTTIQVNRTIKDIVVTIDGDQFYEGCFMGLKQCSETHPCPLHDKYKKIKKDCIEMLEGSIIQDLVLKLELGQSFLSSLKSS